MGKVYPQATDVTEMASLVQVINGIPFFNFSYQVYLNIDLDAGTWDNKLTYNYWMPLNSFSYNYVNDAEGGGEIGYLSMNCNGVQLQFNAGEYVDLNGQVFRLTDVLGVIQLGLGM